MNRSVRVRGVRTVRSALAGALASGVLVGGLAFAAPAGADVTVAPAQAYRGDAAKLTFRVPDERTGAYTTRVELRLPESTPIAEVYPMSVPDWGPSTTTRPLDQALTGIHHGAVTEVTSMVTWVRTAPPAAAGGVAELVVSLGPMPEAEELVFDLTQTYSDGTQVRWSGPPGPATAGTGPAPVVALLPSSAMAPAPAGNEAGNSEVAGAGEPATDGFSNVLRIGLLLVLLVVAALGGAAVARRRHPATVTGVPALPGPPADSSDAAATTAGEPATAGDAEPAGDAARTEAAGSSRWRLRS
ncbi:uncharacterized protein YcnI [Micromonospora pisi]|uniref:Uncharacterized protein YcnI n=1 Tax=Micromonospora pisi TaxID=589240 RepID=A0A495JII2_9ACTN|nr:DUF1775 domain-containing protein [Micromonospora pisi]RKR88132.1 uncharacterized protein YcnI [Micromonospora pisi]